MNQYEITINEAYILDPLLPCASLQVYRDKIYCEAKNEVSAKKTAIASAWYTWKKSLKVMPNAIEPVAVRSL